MILCQNLVRMEDDFCQDKILELGIINVLLDLIYENKINSYVTADGLEALDELFEQYEAYPDKKKLCCQAVENCFINGDSGIEVLE